MQELAPLSAVDVVTANLAAYNARDIDGFMRWFADDVAMIDQETGATIMRGAAEVRLTYSTLFAASPALHADIVSRMAMQDFVVDHERITGRHGGNLEILITYEVVDERIRRVWFVRRPLS